MPVYGTNFTLSVITATHVSEQTCPSPASPVIDPTGLGCTRARFGCFPPRARTRLLLQGAQNAEAAAASNGCCTCKELGKSMRTVTSDRLTVGSVKVTLVFFVNGKLQEIDQTVPGTRSARSQTRAREHRRATEAANNWLFQANKCFILPTSSNLSLFKNCNNLVVMLCNVKAGRLSRTEPGWIPYTAEGER